MTNDIPVQDSGSDSTAPDLDTNTFDTPLPANFDDVFDQMFPSAPAQEEPVEMVDESPVESEEAEEQSPSDDESLNVEQDETEEAEVETAQDESVPTELAQVDYDEAKNFTFPIKNSKTGEIEYKTIDQINAEVNRARSQDDARNEVETARAELDAKTASFEKDQFALQQQQIVMMGEQHMQSLRSQVDSLTEDYNDAASNGDAPRAMQLQAQINQVNKQQSELSAKMQEASMNVANARNEAAEQAAKDLANYGMGDIATDPQRAEAFKEYAIANIPPSVVNVVNTNAALLAMVEKARLYDKAHSEKPKAKLKGSSKTLKGTASKPAPKPKQVDSVQSAIDKMFG